MRKEAKMAAEEERKKEIEEMTKEESVIKGR